ncbi:MAG: hypothetical protein DKT66_08795 [Candidatus Melainabacteria bacterium]|nr:MAG: hypothetical protein DKT66_08795 [Candidatus Melainabacteria bacterium]
MFSIIFFARVCEAVELQKHLIITTIAVQFCTAFDSHLQKHTCAFSDDPYNGFTGADLGAYFLI